MNLPAWLVRNVTYPAHERLRGRPTVEELRVLRRLARATPEAARREVGRRLRDLLVFAGRRLPYYTELFARLPVDPARADPFHVLQSLPVLRKADVRANADGLVLPATAGDRERARPSCSGGTSGDTLHFLIDRVRQAQDLAARLFMQSLFGVQPGEARLHLWGSPIEAAAGAEMRLRRWRDRCLNELLLDAFDLSPSRMDAYLARIRRFRPRVIYGYPSALAVLAQHAARAPGRVHRYDGDAGLRLVVVTGEESTPEQIAQIRQAFGCPVAAEYGNREVGLIGHDCPEGRMHVIWPHIHLEITNGGRHVQPGTCGDVVCTTLNVRVQPFIRYRVGDVGRLLPEACPCGLPWPVMKLEGGKITGFIALPGGKLCHGAITSHVLRDQPGIVAFKTYQRRLDMFEVLLVVGTDFRANAMTTIRERYRRLFGPQIEVVCRVVDSIPPDPSGKRRYVVSEVAPSLDRFELCAVSDSSNTGNAP